MVAIGGGESVGSFSLYASEVFGMFTNVSPTNQIWIIGGEHLLYPGLEIYWCLKLYEMNDIIIAFSFHPHSPNVIHSKKKKIEQLIWLFRPVESESWADSVRSLLLAFWLFLTPNISVTLVSRIVLRQEMGLEAEVKQRYGVFLSLPGFNSKNAVLYDKFITQQTGPVSAS